MIAQLDNRIENITSSGEDLDELNLRQAALTDAYNGWMSALNDSDLVYDEIDQGSSDTIAPHQWFDKWVAENDKGEYEPENPDMWSGLVPETLASRSQARSIPWVSSELPDQEEETLQQTHLIKFDGGGGLLQFSMRHDKKEEHLKKLGNPRENMVSDNLISADLTTRISAKLGAQFNWKPELEVHVEHTHIQEDSKEHSTEIGFVLGDEDSGDFFDVQVHNDPYYGTFIFNTVAGKTKCPHEANTRRREGVGLQISRPTGPTHPDEPMVFKLLLTNEGEDLSSFQIGIDHRSNPGLLVHSMNGDTLTVPQTYDRIDPHQIIPSTLTVSRGPELYKYPPLKLYIRSACEYLRNIGDGNLIALEDEVTQIVVDVENQNGNIVFTEPCTKISWSGLIEDEQKFVINSDTRSAGFKITIENEGVFSFEEAVAQTRLERVELLYRRQNDVDWIPARARPVGESDFELSNFAALGVEDEYGFASLEWEIPLN